LPSIELSFAVGPNERTRPLISGYVRAEGIDLVTTVVDPSEIFWRQLRFGDFDVSEMSLSSFLIATARGDDRWVAIPVYTTRRFFHTWILVRQGAGINEPADLRGKRVGVPEYQQTAAVWSRGILQQEFGVLPGEIEWFMERGPDKSHGRATGFAPPRGVRINQIQSNKNIGDMLLSDELDATLLYVRKDNLVDRSKADLDRSDRIRPLFTDVNAEKARYFLKTGIFPINHVVVMKRALYDRHPWIAINLYKAFLAAKRQAEADARVLFEAYLETGAVNATDRTLLASDLAPYGLREARPVVETLIRYGREQELLARDVALEELFAPSTLDL
jgi:4,5-dihydroxyphthalate decarboxylase